MFQAGVLMFMICFFAMILILKKENNLLFDLNKDLSEEVIKLSREVSFLREELRDRKNQKAETPERQK